MTLVDTGWTTQRNWKTFREREFALGDSFSFRNMKVTFMKSTRKGFNFYVPKYSCLLLRRHLYSRQWSNINIPQGITKFKLRIPEPYWFLLDLNRWPDR